MDLSSFVVNPSINISPYCYSIFRIEPYSICEHKCTYCFGRWYRTENSAESEFNIIQNLRRILRFFEKRGLKTISFRLSTLVDPFQPKEKVLQVSRHIMSLCLKSRCPIIINTKAVLLLEDAYFNVLKKLSDRELVLVQISLSTINTKIANLLEPNAPSPEKRLNSAERLSNENVPIVIRLQPFIPGITDYEAEEIVRQSHYAGVKQIIVEALRDEVENWELYRKLAYRKDAYSNLNLWAPYSPSVEVTSKIIRPSVLWRLNIYRRIKDLCERHKLEFSTCKEGFYNYHTAKNCCGTHYIKSGGCMLRPTLYEVWKLYKERGKIPSFNELVESLSDEYLFGDKIKDYPRPLRRKMLTHERILREILDERRNEIDRLLPALLEQASLGD